VAYPRKSSFFSTPHYWPCLSFFCRENSSAILPFQYRAQQKTGDPALVNNCYVVISFFGAQQPDDIRFLTDEPVAANYNLHYGRIF
jgi:hypothetical protein